MVAFCVARLDDGALDTHLALEFDPVEKEACVWVLREFEALAALVVREEHEAPLIDTLDQHDARRRPAARVDRRKRHRVRFGELCVDGLFEPHVELTERVRVGVGDVQRTERIVFAEVGKSAHVFMQALQCGASIAKDKVFCVEACHAGRAFQALTPRSAGERPRDQAKYGLESMQMSAGYRNAVVRISEATHHVHASRHRAFRYYYRPRRP
ncbi:hypothetical protein PCAR4_630034 [Paraburkholderia caribensis]|nr:hypothetical protein PCAR4_630034 [Paraburkholderia caribensis]